MAQQTLSYPSVAAPPHESDASGSRVPFVRLAALVPAVFLIHGYHPFADDAGIYVAGIRKLLNPALFQPDAPFVVSNTKLSVFAHVLAELVRVTHLPLSIVLLATHLVSIYLFLVGCWLVGSCIFRKTAERWFAVAFAAACFTLPAAGTALAIMDPYVTSRSLSTPIAMFALAAALSRRWELAAMLVFLMGVMHPLMVVYTAALVLLYVLVDTGRVRGAVLLGMGGIALTGLIAIVTRHTPVSHAYYEAMHNRDRAYIFPATWHWYEDFGLIAPVGLMALAMYRAERGGRAWKLCMACILLGVSSIVAAFLFVHSTGPYFLVRLQILRSFQILYLVGVVLLGGWLGKVLWRQKKTRWLLFVLLAAAGGGLYAAQRATYPDSAHVEWPGLKPQNQWVQAFVWIRENTPVDAVFAADPDLELDNGEDMQGFRAIAERSLLGDDKDQGVAAVVNPSIAGVWAKQRDAQVGIDQMSDQERMEKLKPLGVTWLLLPAQASTGFRCPFNNGMAKVCRLP
jgi:hypothetical protein